MNVHNTPNCLLILGCGYVGTKLAETCLNQGIKVKATVRKQTSMAALKNKGVHAIINKNPALLDSSWLADCDAVLDSIPLNYDENRAPLQGQSEWVEELGDKLPSLQWSAYLSATSVYADSGGNWIDESTTHFSTSPRGIKRLAAEQAWLNSSVPTEIFRLAGIYGNERNILSKLLIGNYKTVAWQPEHYANRIHVDDIVAALIVAMTHPQAGRTINLSDDEPCSHQSYVCTLADMIGAPKPIVLTPEEASLQMSSNYLDFFRDNKRVSNQKLHQLLPQLKYPSFRDAIQALQHQSAITP